MERAGEEGAEEGGLREEDKEEIEDAMDTSE